MTTRLESLLDEADSLVRADGRIEPGYESSAAIHLGAIVAARRAEQSGLEVNEPVGDPISESLPYDSEMPDGAQPAWHAVVHLLVPAADKAGTPVDSQAAACDYISETLRGEFLDWGYVRAVDPDTGEPVQGEAGMSLPVELVVCKPYVEGTFLKADDE